MRDMPRDPDAPLVPTRSRLRAPRVLLGALLTGCGGGFLGLGDAPAGGPAPAALPVADPGFPGGYRRWPTADAVPDEQAGVLHRLYRAPDAAADRKGRFPNGAVLVKEHVIPGEDDLVVRIDVRRRLTSGTYGGWEYESYDAATHQRMEIDAEACDLCHQTAPGDGTFTRFAGR
jgi:hypothetical protein